MVLLVVGRLEGVFQIEAAVAVVAAEGKMTEGSAAAVVEGLAHMEEFVQTAEQPGVVAGVAAVDVAQ